MPKRDKDIPDSVSQSLAGATDPTSSKYTWFLKGDARELAAQAELLRVGRLDVRWVAARLAVSSQSDLDKAIALVWKTRTQGWRDYRDELIKLGACTAEQFDAALEYDERMRT
jgi:hypothetical protein